MKKIVIIIISLALLTASTLFFFFKKKNNPPAGDNLSPVVPPAVDVKKEPWIINEPTSIPAVYRADDMRRLLSMDSGAVVVKSDMGGSRVEWNNKIYTPKIEPSPVYFMQVRSICGPLFFYYSGDRYAFGSGIEVLTEHSFWPDVRTILSFGAADYYRRNRDVMQKGFVLKKYENPIKTIGVIVPSMTREELFKDYKFSQWLAPDADKYVLDGQWDVGLSSAKAEWNIQLLGYISARTVEETQLLPAYTLTNDDVVILPARKMKDEPLRVLWFELTADKQIIYKPSPIPRPKRPKAYSRKLAQPTTHRDLDRGSALNGTILCGL